jgi:hypothetical protein
MLDMDFAISIYLEVGELAKQKMLNGYRQDIRGVRGRDRGFRRLGRRRKLELTAKTMASIAESDDRQSDRRVGCGRAGDKQRDRRRLVG